MLGTQLVAAMTHINWSASFTPRRRKAKRPLCCKRLFVTRPLRHRGSIKNDNCWCVPRNRCETAYKSAARTNYLFGRWQFMGPAALLSTLS